MVLFRANCVYWSGEPSFLDSWTLSYLVAPGKSTMEQLFWYKDFSLHPNTGEHLQPPSSVIPGPVLFLPNQ